MVNGRGAQLSARVLSVARYKFDSGTRTVWLKVVLAILVGLKLRLIAKYTYITTLVHIFLFQYPLIHGVEVCCYCVSFKEVRLQ